jgi:hypothetical protein
MEIRRTLTMPETTEPVTEINPQFSTEAAAATPWAEALEILEQAQIYWLSTVRPDGRPHVTPLMGVWWEGAFYFCTGPSERKARNLEDNARCAVTTGCNALEGTDIVLEGSAVRVSEEAALRHLTDLYDSKYGWRYEVREGAFYGEGGTALVYRVAPSTGFGFGKGKAFSQTRWRF